MATGITARHTKACRARQGGRCGCKPTYQAQVFDQRTGKRLSRTFPSHDAARSWRHDAVVAVKRGDLTARPTAGPTLRQAADDFIAGIKTGAVANRSGRPYKPSAIRGYDEALRLRILPKLGGRRIGDIRRRDVQALVDAMRKDGLKRSTIQNTLNPLQAIYRRAIRREDVTVNPTIGLELPAVDETPRDRIADPEEAALLIAALAPDDAALWATAMYAGLRRGELQALTWDDVDLVANVLRVRAGWDAKEGAIEGKTRAARRTVPIVAVLRAHLADHRARHAARDGSSLVFGRTATQPFTPSTIGLRAQAAWKTAKLEAITLHSCRHTAASTMIAAGLNAKAVCTFIGHASVQITFDRYGHLMPGGEDEAVLLLDAYMARRRVTAQA